MAHDIRTTVDRLIRAGFVWVKSDATHDYYYHNTLGEWAWRHKETGATKYRNDGNT